MSINTGLFSVLTNDDEIAVVLGHEMGHGQKDHPAKGARRSLPLPSKKLNHVCEHFGIALDHHNAESDAAACAEVYLRLRAMGVTDGQMRL